MVRVNVDALIRAVQEERRAERQAVEREIRQLPGKERERRGQAILGLKGRVAGELLGQIIVRFSRAKEIRTNIRPGDVVLISKGDPLRSKVTGTVVRVGKHFVDVTLAGFKPWMKRNVRLDFYADDLTFRRWLGILEKPNNNALRLLRILNGKEVPRKPGPQQFDPLNKNLDETKLRAIGQALGAPDVFLIHGPFGTGKTTALAELIIQLVRRGKRVLATAETNVAVDNLVEKLWKKVNAVRVGNPARVNEALWSTTLQAIITRDSRYNEVMEARARIAELKEEQERFVKPVPRFRRGLSNEEIKMLADKGRGIRGVNKETVWGMAEWIRRNEEIQELANKVRKIEEAIARDVIKSADVVLTTNSSAALDIVGEDYDVAVIDEAAQSTIPSVLIPASKAKRVILAGDHKQLPPTIISPKARILERTAFEIIIETYPHVSTMLEVQYRMNETLAEFPSREFYGGRVRTAENVKNIGPEDLGLKEKPITFLDTAKHSAKWERRRAWDNSYKNVFEARIVRETVQRYLDKGITVEKIGVVTPYDAQRDLLRDWLPEQVEVNTVDGYQGREKDIIIISFVRSNEFKQLGFLTDLRRLNVALTRARRKLVIVGDSETLSAHPTYARLIEYVKEHGEYVSLCPGAAE